MEESKIVTFLNTCGLTIKDISKAVGFSYTQIYNVISGKSKPNIDIVINFEKLTNGFITLNDWKTYQGAEPVTIFADKATITNNSDSDNEPKISEV